MSVLDAVAARLGAMAVRDAPLGARTTYRVGGAAAVLVEPASIAELLVLGEAIRGTVVEVLVVGRGSNLLVADAGFDGVAVCLAGEFEAIGEPDDVGEGVQVRAGAAVALPVLARRLAEQGLRGLEWAVGVPGSVGGAVRMNAGGHGDELASSLVEATVVDLDAGVAVARAPATLDLSYRRSSLTSREVVAGATLQVTRGSADDARAEVASVVRWRREHQPGGSNAGSIFKNPPGDFAGRLVEAAGAKGLRLGTAQVSEKHANFIQADAGGSAGDVSALIDEVAARVERAFGVRLEPEVIRVGFGAS
jgi:UDP-N-acetylmuramate dehydrogenase